MKLKNSRWTMVMVGVIALLMVGTMVSASPLPTAPSRIKGLDADKVDGLHASSYPRPGRLLALNPIGRFPEIVISGRITRDKEVMSIVKKQDGPGSGLNADRLDGKHASAFASASHSHDGRYYTESESDSLFAPIDHSHEAGDHTHDETYLNDDRQETISAAVPGPSGILLNVQNTASGSGTIGLYATAAHRGVFGNSDTGTGTSGYSKSGSGAWGYSESGHGVDAHSESGLPLQVSGESGTNLIEAHMPGELRFKVTSSGDVHADGSFYAGQDVSLSGLLRVGQYSADPASCDGTTEGSIYYNTTDNMFYGCNGSAWMALHEGPTPASK